MFINPELGKAKKNPTKKMNELNRQFYDNTIPNSANNALTVWGIVNSDVGNKSLNTNDNS